MLCCVDLAFAEIYVQMNLMTRTLLTLYLFKPNHCLASTLVDPFPTRCPPCCSAVTDNVPMFPGETLNLHLFEPRYKLMMQRVVGTSRR